MMKDKKLSPTITIMFKGLDHHNRFQPGDTVSGVVEIQPGEVIQCRQVVVSIGWHTEGRGDRNGNNIYQRSFDITEIYPEKPFDHHFDVTLPYEPWSYVGELIRIVWEVHAKVDIALAKDINQTLQFVLEPET